MWNGLIVNLTLWKNDFIFNKKNMAYVVLKEGLIMGKQLTVLVNDSEGIPMQFESEEAAQKIANLFESNSTTGNKYYVKQIN